MIKLALYQHAGVICYTLKPPHISSSQFIQMFIYLNVEILILR